MVYGITGATTPAYTAAATSTSRASLTGTAPVVVKYDNDKPAYNTDWNNISPSVGVAWRPALKEGFLSKILSKDPVFRGGYSLTNVKLGTGVLRQQLLRQPGPQPGGQPHAPRRARRSCRSATTTRSCCATPARSYPSAAPAPLTGEWRITPAINESVDIHYPDWPVPQTHQYSVGFQRELGKSTALDIRYVGNTQTGGWWTWNMQARASGAC